MRALPHSRGRPLGGYLSRGLSPGGNSPPSHGWLSRTGSGRCRPHDRVDRLRNMARVLSADKLSASYGSAGRLLCRSRPEDLVAPDKNDYQQHQPG